MKDARDGATVPVTNKIREDRVNGIAEDQANVVAGDSKTDENLLNIPA